MLLSMNEFCVSYKMTNTMWLFAESSLMLERESVVVQNQCIVSRLLCVSN
jgi:hypothetical protein